MTEKAETNEFLPDEQKDKSSQRKTCFQKWWQQRFPSQKFLSETVESIYFCAVVIFLIIADTALLIIEIVLDSFLVQYECDKDAKHSKHNHVAMHRIELAIKVIHFLSIAILVFFVIEIIVQIYAFGKTYWNFKRKKMEYFDAFIVITSLIIDLYILRSKEKVAEDRLLFILSFRLWRFVRIINSVAEAIRRGDMKHKKNLNKQYLVAIHRLFDILKYKTEHLENNTQHYESTLQYFRNVDLRCQSALDMLDQNHELTSSSVVTQFIDELNQLEHYETISVIVVKPHEV